MWGPCGYEPETQTKGLVMSLPAKKFNEAFTDGIKVRSLQIVEPPEASYGRFYGQDYYGTGGSKWPWGLSNSGLSPSINNALTRQNARSAFHDTPQARAIVERFADTVIEVGLKLDATPRSQILDLDPERAEAWGQNVSERFDLWASCKKCHRLENLTFYQAQRLVEIFQQRDNDYFVRLFYSQRSDLLNPLQFGFIDPSQIRGDAIINTLGYQFLEGDGIERDIDGREIAYWVYVLKNNAYELVKVPAKGPKSGKKMILHGFQQDYAFQGRGYSRLAHALQEFENLTDFSTSHIKKAINQSSITMWVKPSPDNPASNPLLDITRPAGQAPSDYIGASPTQSPLDDISETMDLSYIPLPEATITQPGSVGVFNLKEGESLEPFRDTTPAQQYDRFVDSFCAYLAASSGMPIEILLMRFNQNYSASRATLILFWRIAQIWRAEIEADFLRPIYEAWLEGEIAAGRIQAPGWQDPRLRAAWLSCAWIGSPMPNIDPLRTAKADKTYIEIGAQDLDRVAREKNGTDGRANRAKLARQYKELPLPPWEIK